MKAKVKTAFPGVPDGKVHPVEFNVGDEVTGALAEMAVKEGWAVEAGQTKEKPADEVDKPKSKRK